MGKIDPSDLDISFLLANSCGIPVNPDEYARALSDYSDGLPSPAYASGRDYFSYTGHMQYEILLHCLRVVVVARLVHGATMTDDIYKIETVTIYDH